jgi:hypothetical protein
MPAVNDETGLSLTLNTCKKIIDNYDCYHDLSIPMIPSAATYKVYGYSVRMVTFSGTADHNTSVQCRLNNSSPRFYPIERYKRKATEITVIGVQRSSNYNYYYCSDDHGCVIGQKLYAKNIMVGGSHLTTFETTTGYTVSSMPDDTTVVVPRTGTNYPYTEIDDGGVIWYNKSMS